MPFYAGSTRVNLNSASTLYQPADSEGAACNLTSTGTATPFYANGTKIYYSTASWHTLWTGSTTVLNIRQTSKTTNITGLTIPSNVQDYRITYRYMVGLSGTIIKATSLASALPVSYNESGTSYQITINSFTGNSSTGTATIVCSAATSDSGSITLTKIEAYY